MDIKGYRKLSDEETALINKIKMHAEVISQLTNEVQGTDLSDQRWLSIGRTQLQQGFMALIRAVARPTTF